MTVRIVGLGPAGLERVRPTSLEVMLDPGSTLILRTIEHPAARELAALRDTVACDDLYLSAAGFDEVYAAIARRVCDVPGTVVYAVPGSALVGERTVPLVREVAEGAGRRVIVDPGESFIDLALARLGVDPISAGLQIVDGRDLPDPMPFHLPTLITQLATTATAAAVADALGRVLSHDTPVVVLSDLGSPDESVFTTTVQGLATVSPGPRTSAFLGPQDAGWIGLVRTNRLLRVECPWDRKQTHHSLLKHLIEEAYETVDAVRGLPEAAPGGAADYGAYAVVEEELGDLLLQVVFHATMARQAGAFDAEEVAEGIRRKLVARHPHVFGDIELHDAASVEANWERLKAAEKGRESIMDDIPGALPGLARAEKTQRRAASIGFDWPGLAPVVEKLEEEVAELRAASAAEAAAELGDVLFTVVNVARHLGCDAELALRAATARFEARFRWMEENAPGPLYEMSLDEMDELWEAAKRALDRPAAE